MNINDIYARVNKSVTGRAVVCSVACFFFVGSVVIPPGLSAVTIAWLRVYVFYGVRSSSVFVCP